MTSHGEAISDIILPHSPFYQGPYGRMFRNLPPYEPAAGEKEMMALAEKMVEEPDKSDDSAGDNPTIPAGYTYFGQFLNHDITFDPTSSLQRQNDPDKLKNFRTPRFDLDSLYGGGPNVTPFMYDFDEKNGRVAPDGMACYLLEGESSPNVRGTKKETRAGIGPDLPRNEQNKALIGDPRNDINVIISQIHLLFIKFHNKVVTDLINLNQMPLGADLFAEAQRIVCWHYQWAVIHDFLQRIVGQKTYEQICPDPKNPRKPNLNFYKWSEQPFIPVEFSVAAFRLHTMIRARYALNDKLERNRRQMKQKDVPMFLENVSVPPEKASDLRGLRRLPGDWTIQWNRFLDMPDKKGRVSDKLQMSRALNPKLNLHLKHLPFMSKEDRETGRASLAFRTLQRGCQMGLPSGQAVARRMGYCIPSALDTKQDDPLWYYLMKEAEIPEDQGGGGGKHLGPVGGTLVGEVLFGLLAGDPLSYLNVEPLWSPKKERMLKLIPADKKDPADFRLGDIIRYTQMPVDAADIYQLLGKE